MRIGSPLEPARCVGPLIDRGAYERMQAALDQARREGGRVTGGERVRRSAHPDAYYVRPAIVEMPAQSAIVLEETFAPILYVVRYRELEQAIALHNDVPSRAWRRASSRTTCARPSGSCRRAGSDCGIANVNIGPSGAEIGGAFGGEKATGGGREAGSDAWKSYMRRATNTINYSHELPLAQGIKFE